MEFHTSTPFSFVLFGASGNLAKLKIYPALYVLALKKRFPEQYSFVGYARSEMDDVSFRKLVEESIRTDMPEGINEEVLTEFLMHVFYHRGQYDDVKDFEKLHGRLEKMEKEWKDPVRLAYLSIPPTVFTQVLNNLCAAKIREEKVQFRCIVEKPVGHDLQSFEEIRKILTECFDEKEIYLLDHYLGKEAVRNVYYLRYANPILERLFKNTLIRHVEITASESLGLEGRAGYFDAAGTLRDYMQSHMLLMGALLTMRLRENEDTFRDSRLNAVEQFYIPPAKNLNEVILQGQYEAGTLNGKQIPSYKDEEGVAPDSRTNTYIALKLMTRISRWEGIPFYLRSGKSLAERETRISIQFQETYPVGVGSSPNRLDIILQGEAGMRLHLQTKVGGTEPTFRPLVMEDPLVCYGDCLPEHGLLILEAIHGKQQWFLNFEEVHAAWRLIDPLQAHLDRESTPLYPYPAGSDGPMESHNWMLREGIRWF
jgi:glucose-6-phosphate 1-dehydrogenase